MASYDPAVIQAFADAMYQQARAVVIGSTVRWALLGATVGFLGMHFAQVAGMAGGEGAVIGAVLGGWSGYQGGQAQAAMLRLQAQMALCQMTVERNTRGAVAKAA